MSAQPARLAWWHTLRREAVVWLVPLLGLGITAGLWWAVREATDRRAEERFAHQAQQLRQELLARLLTYEQVLRGGAALFDASQSVDREEWRRYVTRLRLDQHLPGVQAVGFVLRVPPDARPGFVQDLQAEGLGPREIHPPSDRTDCYCVKYVEPLEGANLRALAYDAGVEPLRRQALDRARDSGEATLTAPLVLAQDQGLDQPAGGPGVVMFMPVYQADLPLQTGAERDRALRGWVYGAFRVRELVGAMEHSALRDSQLTLFDGAPAQGARLYASANSSPLGRYQVELPLDVAGRRWTAQLHSRPGFDAQARNGLPWATALTGGTLSLMLGWVLAVQARARRRADDAAAALAVSEQRWRFMVHYLPVGAIHVEGESFTLNAAAQAITGYGQDEITTVTQWFQAMYGPKAAAALAQYEADRAAGFPQPRVLRLRRRDGQQRAVRVSGFHHSQGDVWLMNDVTDELESQARARLLVSALEAVGNAVIITDLDARIEWVNPAFEALTGYPLSEALGHTPGELVRSGQQDDTFYALMWDTLHAGRIWQGELINRRRDGSLYHAELTITPVRDSRGQARHYVGVQHDITERKHLENQLLELASTDPLTGLPNRRQFVARMQDELARTRRKPHYQTALLMLDLDHFKRVNDSLGHAAGDAVLRHFAQLLRAALRQVDTPGRIGGEEFAVLLPDTALAAAQTLAERLRQQVEASAASGQGPPVPITVSIGVAELWATDTDVADALARADQALYAAKHSGRNRVVLAPLAAPAGPAPAPGPQ